MTAPSVQCAPSVMVIVPYSEKSFLVQGELTRTYQGNLEKMYGSWNTTLKGYIFSNKHMDPVTTFVTAANAGQVAPVAREPRAPRAAYGNQAASPHSMSAMAHSLPKPPTLRPIAPPPGLKMMNGVTYQNITYSVPMPKVGMKAAVKMGDAILEYGVYSIEPGLGDDIVLARPDESGETSFSRAVIINGKWQFYGYPGEHTITFSA